MRRWLLLVPAAFLVTGLAAAVGQPTGSAKAASSPSPGTPPPEGVHVQVSDFQFDPTTIALGRGQTVVFDFVGPSHHTATDGSGMALYDSGSVGPGEPSFSYTFPAAGGYRFTCTPHAFMGGRVEIPMRVRPATGDLQQTFSATWAASDAAVGYVYDVQIRRPGRRWVDWRVGVIARQSSFTPKAGKGTYAFRARMRSLSGGHALWSAATAIDVTRA